MRYVLIAFPAAVIAYIAIYHPLYFLLYPLSSVDPYLYYSYSPGFWSVDISFWVFTPLYYMWFRKSGENKVMSIIYAFCLDASAVGIFLVFFTIVYGINPFESAYYTYAFVLALMFLVPILDMKFTRRNVPLILLFPIIGLAWRITGTGNIGYFISASVLFDLSMIFYSFLFIYSFSPHSFGSVKKGI
jgi:hypothetical protein